MEIRLQLLIGNLLKQTFCPAAHPNSYSFIWGRNLLHVILYTKVWCQLFQQGQHDRCILLYSANAQHDWSEEKQVIIFWRVFGTNACTSYRQYVMDNCFSKLPCRTQVTFHVAMLKTWGFRVYTNNYGWIFSAFKLLLLHMNQNTNGNEYHHTVLFVFILAVVVKLIAFLLYALI